MRTKVFHNDQWQEYPAKVCVQHTYSWDNEQHDSASTMSRNGTPVAKNLIPNPQYRDDGAGWVHQSGGVITYADGTATLTGEGTYVELSRPDLTFTGGDYVAVRVRYSSNHPIDIDLNQNWDYHPFTPGRLSSGQNMDVIATTQIPETHANGYLALNLLSFGAPGLATIQPIHAATGENETEAVAQVSPYFDGDTPDRVEWLSFTPVHYD